MWSRGKSTGQAEVCQRVQVAGSQQGQWFYFNFHKETGRIPCNQEILNQFDLKTETEDTNSIVNENNNIYELIDISLQEYIGFKKIKKKGSV